MPNSLQSAFTKNLLRHIDLTEDERTALVRLEGPSVACSKRENIFAADRPDDRIAIVRSGWALSRACSDGGLTTITQIYMAGDVIGLTELGFATAPYDTKMQTDGTVSVMSRQALHDFAKEHPRLFRLLLSLVSLDTAALQDRLHAITRFSAEDRLMHFLLTIKAKSEHISDHDSDRFPLPLSQKDIGDVLGLTDIYVNRLLQRLQKGGQLTVNRPHVRIHDRAFWEHKLNFYNRFAEVDFNWAH